MTATDFSDETLMRFADGELDDATSARIEAALATDDALAMRLALFVETRAAAQAALKPLLDEPVPASLVASVEKMIADRKTAAAAQSQPNPTEANVVRLADRKRTPGQASAPARWQLPMAASIAAVLGGVAGFWLSGSADEPSATGVRIAGIGETALTSALATVPAGSEISLPSGSDRFRAIASFRDVAGRLCREFEVDVVDADTVVAVACHRGDAWQVSFAVAAPGADGGYAPASSLDALESYLAAIEASPALAEAEETEALRQLSQAAE